MNIIDLRNIGSFEIPDSFRGILRISPNIIDNNIEDDPTSLLITKNKEVKLTSSEGTILPLTFIPKSFSTTVIDSKYSETDLINITHVYEKLFVINSLNIKSTLDIKLNGKKVPLIFSDGKHSVGYPIEVPDDKSYFNFDNKYNFNNELTYEENIKNILPDDEIYSKENSNQWVNVNGEYLHNYINIDGTYYKLPILKNRDYAIGVCKNHRLNKQNTSNIFYDLSDDVHTKLTHTQLSYIPLESLLYSSLESNLSGITRNCKGRYFNLNPKGSTAENDTHNDLAYTLFDKNISIEDIEPKSPIVGIPVQSGTIHYNAIPARNYFFHLIRRYNDEKRKIHLIDNSASRKSLENNSSTGNSISSALTDHNSPVNAIMRQYVLCDGKKLSGNATINEYHNIDSIAFKNNFSDIHKAITNSTIDASDKEEYTFNTPPLFECDQLSLRFLRGLNWLRTDEKTNYTGNEILNFKGADYETTNNIKFINNKKIYQKFSSVEDPANHSKDIHNVGMHYANTDSALQKHWKHSHLILGAKNNEVVKNSGNDNIAKIKKYFFGEEKANNLSEVDGWVEYVTNANPSKSDKFKNTYILKTINGIEISPELRKRIQNYPIAAMGGCDAYMHSIRACIRFGKRKLGKCCNHRTRCQGPISIRDGYYNFANVTAKNIDDKNKRNWRFMTSLPIANKYGQDNTFSLIPSTATFAGKDEPMNIDDTLGSPPAINFIPLMKI